MSINRAPQQSTNRVMMISPKSFGFNEQTALSNPHQQRLDGELNPTAVGEIDHAANVLKAAGVHVALVDDTEDPKTPDAVFPNNWFSTHEDGTVVLYPMATPNRRAERSEELIHGIAEITGLEIAKIIDLSYLEEEGEILEGTGSLVLDRVNRIAYAALSPRTTPRALQIWSEQMGYRVISFDTVDKDGAPVYHANVLMSVGTDTAHICLDAIVDQAKRNEVLGSLEETGHKVTIITAAQMAEYAGNALELLDGNGERILAMSKRAHTSLTPDQISSMTSTGVRIVTASIPTVETVGGGSLRCTVGELFLPQKTTSA